MADTPQPEQTETDASAPYTTQQVVVDDERRVGGRSEAVRHLGRHGRPALPVQEFRRSPIESLSSGAVVSENEANKAFSCSFCNFMVDSEDARRSNRGIR